MAQSKKEQVHIKLAIAKSALEVVIAGLSRDIGDRTRDQVRDNPELFRKWLAREDYIVQHAGIMRLFESKKKKQGSRMLLAVCEGEFKAGEQKGEPCLYKVRASQSMYDRGVPACPDIHCNHHGKPLIVQQAVDPDEVSVTLGEEMELDLDRQARRAENARETFSRK